MENTTATKLRVWHIPQVPMKAFHVEVSSVEEGIVVRNALANYDLFQFNNNIKPDYCNASGLQVFEDGEWVEWMSEDGLTLDEWEEEQNNR